MPNISSLWLFVWTVTFDVENLCLHLWFFQFEFSTYYVNLVGSVKLLFYIVKKALANTEVCRLRSTKTGCVNSYGIWCYNLYLQGWALTHVLNFKKRVFLTCQCVCFFCVCFLIFCVCFFENVCVFFQLFVCFFWKNNKNTTVC